MIRIAVVDSSAESRGRIVTQIDSFLRADLSEVALLPRVNLSPVSPQELRFNSAPDVCLIGPEIVSNDISEISRIKKLLPNSPILVWLSQPLSNLTIIEQIARLGADDVLTHDVTATYFFRRLLMISRKASHQSSGKLMVVDGGKGGVGVTTIVAALGELISAQGRRVVVVDCDFETQDCSRFLQARPFINENLRQLLDEERAVTEESVEQCLSSIWQDDNSMKCMAPVADADDLYDPRSRLPRIFLTVLEVLDSNSDLVIIDIGCARSSLQKMFYRVADKLVFVVNDDPASLYASVDKLTRARMQLSAGAQVMVVENSVGLSGLGNKLLRKEFSRSAKLDPSHWSPEPIAFCKVGQRWPGSGSTFYAQAKAPSARSLERLAVALELIEEKEAKNSLATILGRFSRGTKNKEETAQLNTAESIKTISAKPKQHLLGAGRAASKAAQKKIAAAAPKLIEHHAGISSETSNKPPSHQEQVAAPQQIKQVVNGEDFDVDSLVSNAERS